MNARTLLSPEKFGDVVATVTDNNPGMALPMAERITTEALKFVATAARFRTVAVAPSRTVDEGWHALILHTALYAELCTQLGGFVHHFPERPDTSRYDEKTMTRTTALMSEAGFRVDVDLWTAPTKTLVPVAANCSHTPVPGGCGPIGPTPRTCNTGD